MSKYSKKQELLKRAIALYNQDYQLTTISRELGIHYDTLRRWLRAEGYKPKKNPHGANPSKNKKKPVESEEKEVSPLEEESLKEDVALQKAEEVNLKYEETYEAAKQSLNPGAAINEAAAQIIDQKLFKFLKNKEITNFKEADIANRMRRDMRGGTNATGSVQIDVSILNKTKTIEADAKIIDAETIEKPSNE